MGKKTLGYQIHSALAEINLQDIEKRTDIYNRSHNTDFDKVGKREFKQQGESQKYIFSQRTAQNITEKSKAFTNFLKQNYNVKMVRDITPQMCVDFLKSKENCSSKTISAYKNMLEKVAFACSQKFNCSNFYTQKVKDLKISTYKTDSSRFYNDKQIEQIYNYDGPRQAEIKTMAFVGVRVFELINIRVQDINLTEHKYTTTIKDNKIDTFSSIMIKGKGGKVSYRPILPQYREFFQKLIKDKQPQEKVFNLPNDTKQARQIMNNEIRRITKALDLPQSGKNHQFRKYHAQLAVKHYIDKGWSKNKAERFVIQRHLSHSADRSELKKIYLYS